MGPVEPQQGECLQALLHLPESRVAAKALQHFLQDEPDENNVRLAHKPRQTTDRRIRMVASRAQCM